MTKKKAAILDVLEGKGPDDYFERGIPPYSASEVARTLNTDLSNVMKTLNGMERDGLVVRELAKHAVWNAIAQGHMERTCVCFWNAATMERDKQSGADYRAGATRRAQTAFDNMFAHPSTL